MTMAMDQLSQRESEVFELAAEGLSNDEIAARLGISRRTVETHLRTVFHKTGVTRRSQLVALARDGVLPAADPPVPKQEARGREAASRPTGEPGADERRLELYAKALDRLVDRQIPLFEESVDITVLVGDRDDQDSIVERRRTVPKPYLVYRVLCPIVAWTGGAATDPDELALACDVHGQDIQTDLSPVQATDGKPVVMVLFQPGLQGPTEWTLRYRAPRLWDPLRRSGTDTLTWATATLDQRHPPAIDRFSLTVVFPPGWTGVEATEDNRLGAGQVERLPTGQTQVTWHDHTPATGEYRWQLHGRPGG